MSGDPPGIYPNNANVPWSGYGPNVPYYPSGSVGVHGETLEGSLMGPTSGPPPVSRNLAGFDEKQRYQTTFNQGIFDMFKGGNNPLSVAANWGMNNMTDETSVSRPANDDVNSNEIAEDVTEEVEKGKGLFGLLNDDMFGTDGQSSGGPKKGLNFSKTRFNPASTTSGGGSGDRLKGAMKSGSNIDFGKMAKLFGIGI